MSTFNKKVTLKRVVSFLVVVCMMLGLMPSLTLLTVNAETNDETNDETNAETNAETPEESTADLWDGTTDTSWYNDYDTEFIIYTAEELAGLAQLVNNGNSFSGKTIQLGNNIDLNGLNWTPIGNTSSRCFSGTLTDNTIS